MKENKCFNTNTYLRLLLIAPAIALLGLTACSTADGTAKAITVAGMQIFLRAPITPRAAVSTDHGPLVRNPLNNNSKACDQHKDVATASFGRELDRRNRNPGVVPLRNPSPRLKPSLQKRI